MDLKAIFVKQGGLKLIRQYWKSGSFFTAVSQFVLLGKSRTALEILRLSAQLKTKQKMEKLYKKKLYEFDQKYDNSLAHKKSDIVWVCWFQGLDNAPVLVKKCYKSLQENLPNKKITLITNDNMSQYVQFPDYILEKWKNGQITHTHMTDLLRLELLIKYGGMWVDATVLCTQNENKIAPYYFDSDLFFYQCLKPGRDGHCSYISSWLISAKSNNKILMATRYLCYEYWKTNKELIDYFLFHDFFSIVLEFYPEEWKKIVPCDNASPHILLLRLFDDFDETIWEYLKNEIPFHKLTYKFGENQSKKMGTYYKMLFAGEKKVYSD